MVGALAEVVEDLAVPTGLQAGGDNGIVEQLAVHHAAAAEGKEEATGFDGAHRAGVEAFVGLHGLVALVLVLGEGRWIHHDDVVGIVLGVGLEPLHNVGRVGLMTVGEVAVAVDVFFG